MSDGGEQPFTAREGPSMEYTEGPEELDNNVDEDEMIFVVDKNFY